MKRLSMRPAKKAPNIASSPMKPLKAPLRNITAITNVNCITESEYLRRNQRVRRGMKKSIPVQKAANLRMNANQNKTPPPDVLKALTIAATTMSDISSDNMDEPTLRVAVMCFCSPYLPTIG